MAVILPRETRSGWFGEEPTSGMSYKLRCPDRFQPNARPPT
jgi:hypothetical protein